MNFPGIGLKLLGSGLGSEGGLHLCESAPVLTNAGDRAEHVRLEVSEHIEQHFVRQQRLDRRQLHLWACMGTCEAVEECMHAIHA